MYKITQKARTLRINQTQAENLLWQHLRAMKTGFRIVRQKPILFNYFGVSREFVADFYCRELSVVIEVDGQIRQNQLEYDRLRTELMSVMNIAVIRFKNEQIIDDVHVVVEGIISFLRKRREDVAKRQERGGE